MHAVTHLPHCPRNLTSSGPDAFSLSAPDISNAGHVPFAIPSRHQHNPQLQPHLQPQQHSPIPSSYLSSQQHLRLALQSFSQAQSSPVASWSPASHPHTQDCSVHSQPTAVMSSSADYKTGFPSSFFEANDQFDEQSWHADNVNFLQQRQRQQQQLLLQQQQQQYQQHQQQQFQTQTPQDSFINPRHVLHDDQQIAMLQQQFQNDLDSKFSPPADPSPHIYSDLAPGSYRDTPCSGGEDGGHNYSETVSADGGDAEDETDSNEPYNRLLWKCLMGTDNKEMLLKHIYLWFQAHTDKGRDPKSKGWQNSIRHNLSMNPAFHKGSRTQPESNTANMWSLTEDAIHNGVEPTTRFRNSNKARNRTRVVIAPGAARTTRSAGRTRPLCGYGYRDPSRVTPHTSTPAPTSSPYQHMHGHDLSMQDQVDPMFDSMGSWDGRAFNQNGHGGAGGDSTPYYLDAMQTSSQQDQVVQSYEMPDIFDGNMFSDNSASGIMIPSSSMGMQQAMSLQPEPPTSYFPTSNSNYNYYHGKDSLMALDPSLRRSPAESTPSLQDSHVTGVVTDGDAALFVSDGEDSDGEQQALKTPPQTVETTTVSLPSDAKMARDSNEDFEFLFNGAASM